MGCLCDKHKTPKSVSEDNAKEYSWDQRRCTIDPKDFTMESAENTEVRKLPGSINGQQYVVRNCKNTCIYLLDHINTLTIDDCSGCKFIVGPVKGSVFLRDCKDCSCLVACGQYRMRDCYNVNVFLCCPTQPIVESSRRIHFGCYQLYYNKLEDQFKSAGLSVFNNNWSNVHDFTPTHGETNWCLLPNTMSVSDYICLPPGDFLEISCDRLRSVVPLTSGVCPETSQQLETCLVVFFNNSQAELMANSFVNSFSQDRPYCWLVTTRQLTLESRESEVVFGSTSYARQTSAGPLIGLVCAGPRAIYCCQKTVEKLKTSSESVYVSHDPRTASIQAETFISVAAMVLAS